MRGFVVVIAMLATASVLGACGSPSGSNWAEADFNKYGNNYAPFPTDRIRVGMSQAEASGLFQGKMTRISAEAGAETFAVERWTSVAGPDYVDERLFMRFAGGKLTNWKIEKVGSSAVIVPRSW